MMPALRRHLSRLVSRALGKRPTGSQSAAPRLRRPAYPGDFIGVPTLVYAPKDDGLPDPGEVVWAWVPFEEDHSQGKDRPVLVIGKDGAFLLCLMLTSKDHDRDDHARVAGGRHWLDLGPGGWDRRGRPSEVRLDRILRLDPAAVRREGAVIGRELYDAVAAEVSRLKS